LIEQELGDGECGAFLVWGDPSLYDSTLRIIDQIIAKGNRRIRVRSGSRNKQRPGIGCKTQDRFNRIGRSVHITTGRKISEGLPDDIDDVVAMLDATARSRLSMTPVLISTGVPTSEPMTKFSCRAICESMQN
jgi:precorrin-6A synthase